VKVPQSSFLGKMGNYFMDAKNLLMQTVRWEITKPYSIFPAGLDYPGVGPMHATFIQKGGLEFIARKRTYEAIAGRYGNYPNWKGILYQY